MKKVIIYLIATIIAIITGRAILLKIYQPQMDAQIISAERRLKAKKDEQQKEYEERREEDVNDAKQFAIELFGDRVQVVDKQGHSISSLEEYAVLIIGRW